MNEIILDGESLTFEQVLAVAFGKPNAPRVVLSEKAEAQVNRSANAVQKLLERGEIAYGITTGFGAFKDKIISREEVEILQRNIVVSHAVGVGKPFDISTTRAIMLIRANTLARGFSGIRLETLESFARISQSRRSSDYSRKRKFGRKRRSRAARSYGLCFDRRRRSGIRRRNFTGKRRAEKSRSSTDKVSGKRRFGIDQRHDRDDRYRLTRNCQSDIFSRCRRYFRLSFARSIKRHDTRF